MKKYDWSKIKRRYIAGESAYHISKSMKGRPTRQAIESHVKKEGWKELRNLAVSVSGQEITKQTPKDKRVTLGKRTPENMALIIEKLRGGATLKVAAAMAGISIDTLARWRKTSPEFAAECGHAQAAAAMRYITCIDNASNADWRAASYRLERMPITKEDFLSQAQKGLSLSVAFNFSRDSEAEIPGVVIEGTTE